MLVLSRKTGQKLHIGDNITLTVLKTQGSTVRIGIEAPRDVTVRRAELPPLGQADSTAPEMKIHAPVSASDGKSPEGELNTSSPTSVTGKSSGHPSRWSVNNMEQRVRDASSSESRARDSKRGPLSAKILSV